MGSPPTVTPTPDHLPELDRPTEDRELQARHPELLEHLQTRPRPAQPRLATDFTHTHPELSRDAVREGERAFDRLNPDYGVPADQRSAYGRQAVRERETALALGIRVAVHDSRQNDPNPVIWQAGQD